MLEPSARNHLAITQSPQSDIGVGSIKEQCTKASQCIYNTLTVGGDVNVTLCIHAGTYLGHNHTTCCVAYFAFTIIELCF